MAMAAVPVAKGGAKLAAKAIEAVKADLVVIGTQVFRKVKVGKGRKAETLLVPIDLEFHLSPLNLALGALALGGALVLAVAEVDTANPLTGAPVTLYKGPLADEWNAWKKRTKALKGPLSGAMGEGGGIAISLKTPYAKGSVGEAIVRQSPFRVTGNGKSFQMRAGTPAKVPVGTWEVTPLKAFPPYAWSPPSETVDVKQGELAEASFTLG